MLKVMLIRRSLLALIGTLACSVGGAWANDCQIQISQPVVDYGSLNPNILRAEAKASPTIPLGKRLLQMNILCSEAQYMHVSFRGLASALQSYKLDDKGEFDLIFKNASLDGNSVLLGSVSTPGEVPGDISNEMKLKPEKYLVPVWNQQPHSGKALSVSVELDVRLFVDGLKVRDAVGLEGRGSFELTP